MVEKITVEEALKIPSEEVVFIDTRSPKEFEEDNIPKSINIPLFSNEERAIIGTLYKQEQVKAYQKGIDIYNKKILDFIDQFKKIDKNKKIIIYCWRGGMRSKTIAHLVENIHPQTFQLENGYKKFREFIRNKMNNFDYDLKLIVLQGMAGSGKTDLIKKIEPSIDLEGLAKHRSSLFGAIGLKPVSQKKFESRLWEKLEQIKNEKTIFIEGEARKIGNLFVPTKLFEKIENSKTVKINSSIEMRTKRIIKDYFSYDEDKKIKEIIIKLKRYLSKKVIEELLEHMNKKEYKNVAKTLLEDYYDDQYKHALKDKKYCCEIESDNMNKAIKELNKLKSE